MGQAGGTGVGDASKASRDEPLVSSRGYTSTKAIPTQDRSRGHSVAAAHLVDYVHAAGGAALARREDIGLQQEGNLQLEALLTVLK